MIAIEKIDQLSIEQLGLVTVLTGDDEGQYSLMKQMFLEKIGYDSADLSYSYFDLSETSYRAAALDLESLPFFSEQKIVVLDRLLDITTQKKSYLDEEEMKQFESYLENPVITTRLVIFAEGKLDSKRRLVKLLKRDAQIFEATTLKTAEFKTYFQKVAHGMHLIFESGVFEELLVKSNFEFNDMQKNLAFLQSYKPEGLINLDDVKKAIPKTLQDNLFDLTQFVLDKKIDLARNLVKDLVLQGEDEVKLLAIMISQFRFLLQVKLLEKKGRNESQIVSELSDYLGRRLNPYQVKYALRDVRKIRLKVLQKSLKILIETDFSIKNGSYDKAYLFDLALLKMMTPV